MKTKGKGTVDSMFTSVFESDNINIVLIFKCNTNLESAWKFEVTLCDLGLWRLTLVKVLQKHGVKFT
jgi:hypothetical protein